MNNTPGLFNKMSKIIRKKNIQEFVLASNAPALVVSSTPIIWMDHRPLVASSRVYDPTCFSNSFII